MTRIAKFLYVHPAFYQRPFNYLSLDNNDGQEVRESTLQLKAILRRTAQDIVAIGQILIKVKQKLPHGHYGKWLESELGWSDFTARQFVNVATVFKSENFSDLDFDPSALYLLSVPSTPIAARQEALERAKCGETISHKVAKDIIQRHKTKVPKDPKALSLSDNDSLPQSTDEPLTSKLDSAHKNSDTEVCTIEIIAQTIEDSPNTHLLAVTVVQPEQRPIFSKFAVGDRVRILRRQEGEDKWTGCIAHIWEITPGGWLRVDVQGYQGVRFTLHPDWVELITETNMTEPNITQPVHSAPLSSEHQIQVQIPLNVDGQTIQIPGIVVNAEVLFTHEGTTRLVRVPAEKISFPASG